MDTSSQKIIIGRFGAPHGIRGWIKVNSFTRPKENIVNYLPWLVEINNQVESIKIVDHQFQSKTMIARIERCEDRNKAAELTNTSIFIFREQLPDLAEDEYYWSDLEGLTVINQDNVNIGIIDHLISTGSNDVLVIKDGKKQFAIPYIPKEVVLQVDLKLGIMQVNWEDDG